jgi:hypothetical protein
MAEYLYLFRGGERPKSSPDAMQKHMEKWRTWIGSLAQQGKFKAGDPLEDGGKTVAGKNKTVTDGPYAEAKDLVGGYLIVTAGSLNEATEMSRGCPIFETNGAVEIRAIAKM